MTSPILTLDTEQCYITRTFTLYNRAHGLSFTFDDAGRMQLFLRAWYVNHINARFAYECGLKGVPCGVVCVDDSGMLGIAGIWDA